MCQRFSAEIVAQTFRASTRYGKEFNDVVDTASLQGTREQFSKEHHQASGIIDTAERMADREDLARDILDY